MAFSFRGMGRRTRCVVWTFSTVLTALPLAAQQAACPNNIQDQTGMFVARLQKSFDQTASAADIDGDGIAEVVARGVDGVHTWHFDAQTFVWKEAVSDTLTGPPWDLPRYHRSLRLIDADGDGRADLLAKGPDGILAWRYKPADGSWEPITQLDATILQARYEQSLMASRAPVRISVPFPAFTGGQATAYDYISTQLLNGAPNASIRAQYSNAALEQNFASSYPTTMKGLSPPANVSASDWTVVVTKLSTEFSYVAAVDNWFALMGNLYSDQGIAHIISAVTVANILSIPNPTNNNDQVLVDILQLFGSLVSSFASIGGPEASIIANLANTAFDEALSAIGSGGGDPIKFASTVAQLDNSLGIAFDQSITANGCQEQSYTTDWGLLQSLGKPITQGILSWPDPLTGELVQASKVAYETTVYQTLTPIVWTIEQRCSNPDPGYQCESPPPTPYKLWVPSRHGYLFISFAGSPDDPPPVERQDHLFQQPPNGLGASLSAVLQSQDGWKMPFGGICSPIREAARRAALEETIELQEAVALLPESDRAFLNEPLQAARRSLQQGETSKSASLIEGTSRYLSVFHARITSVSQNLTAVQSASLEKSVAHIEHLLVPTTEAGILLASPVTNRPRTRLDATDSASVDGSDLTYAWYSVDGRATIVHPELAAPLAKLKGGPGKYHFKVTVTDSFGNTSSDTVTMEYRSR